MAAGAHAPGDPRWHDVGEPDDYPDGGVWPAMAGGIAVAVFRIGDQLFGLHDQCTHGTARLSEGYVSSDGCVECPLHQGRVDIRTGQPLCAPITEAIRRFEVRVVDGRVQVAVPG